MALGNLGDPGLTAFSFTILGQSLGISEDAQFPDYPIIEFFAYQPDFLDFEVIDLFPIDIHEPGVESITLAAPLIASASSDFDYFIEADISSVPVPAATWLFGSGLLGMIGIARHKKAS